MGVRVVVVVGNIFFINQFMQFRVLGIYIIFRFMQFVAQMCLFGSLMLSVVDVLVVL